MTIASQDGTGSAAIEPIAIVGVGCRLPDGVSSVEGLVEVLEAGRSCISTVPEDRWDVDAFYDPDPLAPGKTYCRHGGFVTDIDRFDPGFFGISDGEAARMDPQQRIVLETVWHALEDAGQSATDLEQSETGVFLAMMNTNGYAQLKAHVEGMGGVTGYDAMADSLSITAGRIAHFLALHGPCVSVDTACSGSMVATHLARQSILAGECDTAIVVGVNAIVHPSVHIAFSKVGLMSRSGQCHTFDEAADGYVRGEGCVAVLLRRQSLALERGDRILASIVGTAMNQDGRTPALTAPNGQMQEQVMRRALARLGVTPDQIRYVEAHGTGTPVGDPIEMSAITNVFGPDKTDEDPLYVGSVKTNFGHLESAAGALGLVKAALSLDRETIFPNRNFTTLNPSIRLVNESVRIPTTPVPWPRGARPRLVGVNSFGYSGTNVHAVLSEAPADTAEDSSPERPAQLVVVSAKTAVALQDLADRWAGFCDTTTAALADITFTAATGRTPMRHRLAVVGRDTAQVAEQIRAWRDDRAPQGVAAGQPPAGRAPKVAFVFSGQGSQHPGMGRQLYEAEPVFRDAIDRCAAIMDGDLGMSLCDLLFSAPAEVMRDTRYAQPALFAIGYALATQLRHWGVEPAMALGHSVGEVTAACVAGVLDLDDAARFILARGHLMGELPEGGSMLAVNATAEQATAWITGHEDDLALAAVNGPTSVVVSGRASAIESLAERVGEKGHRATMLAVSHAFHSPLMEPMLDELGAVAGLLDTSPGTIPVVSNVTGAVLEDAPDAAYWTAHARQAVRFHDGIRTVLDEGCSVLVEVGPHPVLLPGVAAAVEGTRTRLVPTLRRDGEDVAHALEAVGALWISGAPVNLDRVFARQARRVSLPLYPFRKTRYWIDGRLEDTRSAQAPAVDLPAPELPDDLHALLAGVAGTGPGHAVFETALSATIPWADHRVLGTTVFPATGYLEMVARGHAAFHGEQWRPATLNDVRFERPLLLDYEQPAKVRLRLERRSTNGSGEITFTVTGDTNVGEVAYCRGAVSTGEDAADAVRFDDELARMSPYGLGPFYGELRHVGLEYGLAFATVRELWRGDPDSGEAIGRVSAGADDDDAPHPFVWTTVLDGCLQLLGGALGTQGAVEASGAFIPSSIRSVILHRPLPPTVWGHLAVRTSSDGRAAVADLRVTDGQGNVIAELAGIEFRQKASLTAPDDALAAASEPAGHSTESRDELLARLGPLTADERVSAVIDWLTAEVTDTLGHAAEGLDLAELDPSTAFLEIGLDSLLVTELQRRIQEKLGFRFEPMQALDYQSIESLSAFILEDVLGDELAGGKPQEGPTQTGLPVRSARPRERGRSDGR